MQRPPPLDPPFLLEDINCSTRVLTENPESEIWSYLVRLSDIGYLARAVTAVTKDATIAITTLLSQAYEYYSASRTISLNTKPLLIYYSFLCLTKALILAATKEEPPPYHGLCKPQTLGTFLNYNVEANHGVFKTLCNLLGCSIQIPTNFAISSFFENAIELSGPYAEYFNQGLNIVNFQLSAYQSGRIMLVFRKVNDGLTAKLNRTRIVEDFRLISDSRDQVIYQCDSKWVYDGNYEQVKSAIRTLLLKFSEFSPIYPRTYYVNLNDPKLPQLAAYYGLMFCLSSMVRYNPNLLFEILWRKEVSINWFLEKACSISLRVFPNLILNQMYGRFLNFGPSS